MLIDFNPLTNKAEVVWSTGRRENLSALQVIHFLKSCVALRDETDTSQTQVSIEKEVQESFSR